MNTLSLESKIARTARVIQLEGLFGMNVELKSVFKLDYEAFASQVKEDDWNIGLVVGASGSGKSSVTKQLFASQLSSVENQKWSDDAAIVDGFPSKMPLTEVCELLSSVGFSSPPAWLRPFRVLSNGEKFRVTMARAIAETSKLLVMDEYTSLIDRQVARIGSHAIQKTIRSKGLKFLAVTCHYDVIDWLQPDWIYEPEKNTIIRRQLRQRPAIDLKVYRGTYQAWREFSRHHYLDADLNRSARILVCDVNGESAGMVALLPSPNANGSFWRVSRVVVKPDYQGVGIGTRFLNMIGGAFKKRGAVLTIVTSHPAMSATLTRNGWEVIRKPSRSAADKSRKTSNDRLTMALKYRKGPDSTLDAIWQEHNW